MKIKTNKKEIIETDFKKFLNKYFPRLRFIKTDITQAARILKNKAEQLLFSAETQLKDIKDKMTSEDFGNLESKIKDLKSNLETNNVTDIKTSFESLQSCLYSISEKMYSNTNQQTSSEQNDTESSNTNSKKKKDDDIIDADFEDVK